MKKYLMLMAVAAIALTSCGKDDEKNEPKQSDAEKVAQLIIDYEEAMEDDDFEKAAKIEKKAKEIIGDREGDEDFAEECKKAYEKLTKDKK